mmetsp:Transcript_4473/g.14859  ORF Transcript_4473/g.14859 Transcript_4473/m.14859 type:complete len:205 (+) Transcript_4473:1917-2531(+)
MASSTSSPTRRASPTSPGRESSLQRCTACSSRAASRWSPPPHPPSLPISLANSFITNRVAGLLFEPRLRREGDRAVAEQDRRGRGALQRRPRLLRFRPGGRLAQREQRRPQPASDRGRPPLDGHGRQGLVYARICAHRAHALASPLAGCGREHDREGKRGARVCGGLARDAVGASARSKFGRGRACVCSCSCRVCHICSWLSAF